MKTLPKGSKTKGEKDPGEAIPIEKIDKILNSISDNDARLLGFTETTEEMIERGVPEDIANIRGLYMTSHPRDMIMYGMLIPPLIARAPRYINGKLFYDTLDYAYLSIIRRLRKINELDELDKNYPIAAHAVYKAVRRVIFNLKRTKAAASRKMSSRDLISIVERIQGKRALLRNLLIEL